MRVIESTRTYCCQHCFKNFKRGESVAYVKNNALVLCQACTNQFSNISIKIQIYDSENNKKT